MSLCVCVCVCVCCMCMCVCGSGPFQLMGTLSCLSLQASHCIPAVEEEV